MGVAEASGEAHAAGADVAGADRARLNGVAPLPLGRSAPLHHRPGRPRPGRPGLPTAAHLDFQEAHARARDAVCRRSTLARWRRRWRRSACRCGGCASQAVDRRSYLLRPDLGRRLREADRATLPAAPGCVLFVLADGLCATGVQAPGAGPAGRRAAAAGRGRAGGGPDHPGQPGQRWRSATRSARRWAAAMVAVLIGERPGLSATDSLGVYLTLGPRRGRTRCRAQLHLQHPPRRARPAGGGGEAGLAGRAPRCGWGRPAWR